MAHIMAPGQIWCGHYGDQSHALRTIVTLSGHMVAKTILREEQVAMAPEPSTIVPQPKAPARKGVTSAPKEVATSAVTSQANPVVIQVRIPIGLL